MFTVISSHQIIVYYAYSICHQVTLCCFLEYGSFLLAVHFHTHPEEDHWKFQEVRGVEQCSNTYTWGFCLRIFYLDTVPIYFLKVLTLWCLKKVFMDKQPRPIWENILNTLDADPSANKISRQRRKLPARNFVPGRNGVVWFWTLWIWPSCCQPDELQLGECLLCSYGRSQTTGATGWGTRYVLVLYACLCLLLRSCNKNIQCQLIHAILCYYTKVWSMCWNQEFHNHFLSS